eukprot:CAMPEP_0170569872 /NCGR_PEP_ID=MMETSP0224-20130122/796_1 /TAXON_ID=285029 /ORGANISM="Togula jolla, Strain CCCM 725" /LENGTH=539 /DNA_ID=CAMNT_0010892087 /DNA_START=15 /DNA_END=1634 /DNA_ORIENTATION=-
MDIVWPDDRWINQMAETALPECQAARIRHRADTAFMLIMGGRIFAMQTGFAMLEAAYARPSGAANIMMKNLMDMLVGAIAFFFVGFEIAYGIRPGFIDDGTFDWTFWFIQFSYATTAATIDSGALAGRVSFNSYVLLSMMMSGVIYPVVLSWTWGGGWLQKWGFIDFAGGVVVHAVGASSALVCAAFCGPRIGRFRRYCGWRGVWAKLFMERRTDEYYRGPQNDIERVVFEDIRLIHNPVQALFGGFLLFCGFLAFNPASTYSTIKNDDLVVARATAATLLSGASTSVAVFLSAAVLRRSAIVSVPEFSTALVAGLVSSCSCCHVVPAACSILIGLTSALVALATQHLLDGMMIDDTVSAVAAHGPPGILGSISVALFAKPDCTNNNIAGLFFGGGQAAWELLGVQLTGCLAIVSFSLVATYVTVFLIDRLVGFRCSRAAEIVGLDYVEHDYEDGTMQKSPEKSYLVQETPEPHRNDSFYEKYKHSTSPNKLYAKGSNNSKSSVGSAGSSSDDKKEQEPPVEAPIDEKEAESERGTVEI